MDEIKDFLKKQQNTIIILVLAAVTLIPVFIPNIDKNPQLWYLAGWVFWVSKLLVEKVDRLNLLWNRFLLRVLGGAVAWNISAELQGNFDTGTLDRVTSKIQELYNDAKLWPGRNDQKIIRLPIGGVLRMYLASVPSNPDDFENVFAFEVSDFIVPFRQSEKLLDEFISLIDSTIKREINPTQEKYVFKIKFGETNPYFGLFVRRFEVPKHKLITFRLEFDEKIGLNVERVDVGSQKLTLVAHSLTSLQRLSKKYITLSNLDMVKS